MTENRQYGYKRWYSQLKRIQRFGVQFPDLFPTLLDFGLSGDKAYFDLEYIEGGVNCHDYVCGLTERSDVEQVLGTIIERMDIMHRVEMKSFPAALGLYIREEVHKRLHDALLDENFKGFYDYEYIYLNDIKITPIGRVMDDYIRFGHENYVKPRESFTHGNITLENMMYVPGENRIVFIDPYEENVIDNIYNEYSQILQSSNSHYEIYNAATPVIEGNRVTANIDVPWGLNTFNDLFFEFMERSLSEEEVASVRFFEISQFIRMLPFKAAIDKPKMKLFYSLASKIFNDLSERN